MMMIDDDAHRDDDDDENNHNNNNSNNNRIDWRDLRFFYNLLAATRTTLKWPGRSRVQITCNTQMRLSRATSRVPLCTKGQVSY